MHKFQELKIWQKSRSLVKVVYTMTKDFPQEEIYSLTSQIRRCVVSIPSNIAEWCGRKTDAEPARFLDIANGSAFELETQILLSSDLDYISKEKSEQIICELHEIEKMIYNFKLKLK